MNNGEDVLADLRITEGPPEMIGMVPDWNRAEADRRLRQRNGNSEGHCRDCGLPVWWHDDNLVTRDGNRWCYGPHRSRIAMERHHALPGMPQFVVRAPVGKVCHCLDRANPHIHQIIDLPDVQVETEKPRHKYEVVRRWQVEAINGVDALVEARPGEHRDASVHLISDLI